MYAEERHLEIIARAKLSGRVDVSGLAQDLHVAGETIRRDLKVLERRGLVHRVHGGAIAVERLEVVEPALSEREQSNAAHKIAIARAARDFLPESGSVILDAGSTTAALAQLFPTDSDLTVLTHSVPHVSTMLGLAHIDLHVVGGQIRRRTLAAVGPWARGAYGEVRADVVFIGTNGVSLDRGLTTPDQHEADIKRSLTRAARRKIVLADHSKLGRDELVSFAQLADVDTIITDSAANSAYIEELRSHDIQVVLA